MTDEPIILKHPKTIEGDTDEEYIQRTKIDLTTQPMEVKVTKVVGSRREPGWLKTALSCLLLIAGLTALGAGYVVRSYFEAEAFNRNTGKNVSTWDAIFLELRINGDERDFSRHER